MSLKQLINRKKQINYPAIDFELTIPGEPMIYSVKYRVGERRHYPFVFRNRKLYSMLRCQFRAYLKTHIPVVLFVKFYVTPPEHAQISMTEIRKDDIPAVKAYECCDYLLSFMEILHHVLLNSYRQIVKVDVEKFYSNNPRTTMKFMKWEDYGLLQAHNTKQAKTKAKRAAASASLLCTDQQGSECSTKVCGGTVQGQGTTIVEGTTSSGSTLPIPVPKKVKSRKTQTAKLPTPRDTARRRQSREIPQ